ncbi:hypothetical protein K493DRAFT_412305 [Basidiobolus meristosporus CBS 931.73]|uniref:Uncharacterized protein n=1 Tax=Basidiobolus meristosporus CBS 931.73 TaxID=1314790 RepID=A0A1Y1X0N5_9FUNG|nr:hypothetical protein K493DRAFT_412305 [Basidiobolus meristosporus CBS 931.73]|eukprot:ORX78976.1 hypothetical protein K493DRAFT_412305 [Basidiobolus meristosporus CBS 931.73]
MTILARVIPRLSPSRRWGLVDLPQNISVKSSSEGISHTNSTNYQSQQTAHSVKPFGELQLDEDDWEEDFAFEQELAIPSSLQNTQASLNKDRQSFLQVTSKIQELKLTLHQVQTSFDPLMEPQDSAHLSTPLSRDIQLSKILIDMSEDSSCLLESVQPDTSFRTHIHRFLFFCDLATWETLAHSPTLNLDNLFYTHSAFLSSTKDASPIASIQWVDLLASKIEVLQSRLEKYLTELHCVSRMASHV